MEEYEEMMEGETSKTHSYETIRKHRENALKLRECLSKLSQKQRIELVDSRTLQSVQPGSVLEFTTNSALRDAVGSPTQIGTVSIWQNGNLLEHDVRMVLPLRLSGGETPFPKGSILVFMGKGVPKNQSGELTNNWFWHTHMLVAGKGKSAQMAKKISQMSVEEMKKKYDRGTLDKFKAGTILSFWEVSVQKPAKSEARSEPYAVVKYSVESQNSSGQLNVDEGEVAIPGRFISRLTQPNALPCHAIYEGKRRSKQTNREFHDLIFIDGNNARIQQIFGLK